ncbi:hypothetical protein CPB83DRAFT_853372 [Crepidotus variabilis]|uniref:Uncharacterized protein n=1 Tax=Crepidotus variabilis TaxID=179855 RepID=A0A9P6EH46_9AGAR|nr:hypothetical protein CPB83DRAFT_853372 [Crepidotus variabilis]
MPHEIEILAARKLFTRFMTPQPARVVLMTLTQVSVSDSTSNHTQPQERRAATMAVIDRDVGTKTGARFSLVDKRIPSELKQALKTISAYSREAVDGEYNASGLNEAIERLFGVDWEKRVEVEEEWQEGPVAGEQRAENEFEDEARLDAAALTLASRDIAPPNSAGIPNSFSPSSINDAYPAPPLQIPFSLPPNVWGIPPPGVPCLDGLYTIPPPGMIEAYAQSSQHPCCSCFASPSIWGWGNPYFNNGYEEEVVLSEEPSSYVEHGDACAGEGERVGDAEAAKNEERLGETSEEQGSAVYQPENGMPEKVKVGRKNRGYTGPGVDGRLLVDVFGKRATAL